MSETFKSGDTVQLKSGGPVMTVTEAFDEFGVFKVRCKWFVGTKLEKGEFTSEAVKLAEAQ